jgi:hypothetical protein
MAKVGATVLVPVAEVAAKPVLLSRSTTSIPSRAFMCSLIWFYSPPYAFSAGTTQPSY